MGTELKHFFGQLGRNHATTGRFRWAFEEALKTRDPQLAKLLKKDLGKVERMLINISKKPDTLPEYDYARAVQFLCQHNVTPDRLDLVVEALFDGCDHALGDGFSADMKSGLSVLMAGYKAELAASGYPGSAPVLASRD